MLAVLSSDNALPSDAPKQLAIRPKSRRQKAGPEHSSRDALQVESALRDTHIPLLHITPSSGGVMASMAQCSPWDSLPVLHAGHHLQHQHSAAGWTSDDSASFNFETDSTGSSSAASTHDTSEDSSDDWQVGCLFLHVLFTASNAYFPCKSFARAGKSPATPQKTRIIQAHQLTPSVIHSFTPSLASLSIRPSTGQTTNGRQSQTASSTNAVTPCIRDGISYLALAFTRIRMHSSLKEHQI